MVSFRDPPGADLRKQPQGGRFQKFAEFGQSKGIGGLVWPRRSWFGYWFGCPTTIGGEIVQKGY
jgi:hypothetical protein